MPFRVSDVVAGVVLMQPAKEAAQAKVVTGGQKEGQLALTIA